ncbi:signal peptidase I, partial [Ruminococcus callidus]
IIATGGQEINIDFATGEVTVDGEVLDEPYIRELTANQEDGFASYPVTVPEGYYFVMGDNRNNSTDSRSQFVGFVPRDAILGKAIFRISPDDFGSIYKNMK